MPKIARGTCGASSVTSASRSAGSVAGLRSPDARRSRTVTPPAKGTTSSPRTSPLCGPPPPGARKVASFTAATLRVAGQRAQRGPDHVVALARLVLRPPPRDAAVHGEARLEVVLDDVDLERDGRDAVGDRHGLLHHRGAGMGGAGDAGGHDGERAPRVGAQPGERLTPPRHGE